MATDLLEGEILKQYRSVVDAVAPEKKKKQEKEEQTEAPQCSFVEVCSEGCTGATTDEKKRKKQARVAGWFDPPVA
ncbi:MAG: hypothetical protein ABSF62_05810 [Bryobacteraceae bacterium]|jgi:radical SAM protein with 4Fe4S-binding SPASM domain